MQHSEARYPSRPMNLWKAWKAFRGLVGDRNDTRYVFEFFENVNGRSYETYYDEFLSSDYGREIVHDFRSVGRFLSDRKTLESYGPGTFAAAYLKHMDANGFTAEGVFEASLAQAPERMKYLQDNFPDLYAINYMGSVTHDMYHVLSGYGADPLGEALLLVYSAQMSSSRGANWLGRLAGLQIRSEIPAWPVGRMMDEAVRNARNAVKFHTVDLTSYMHLPIDEARAELKVDRAALYEKTLAEWDGPMPVPPQAEAA